MSHLLPVLYLLSLLGCQAAFGQVCPEGCNGDNCDAPGCAGCEWTCGGQCTYRAEWHDAWATGSAQRRGLLEFEYNDDVLESSNSTDATALMMEGDQQTASCSVATFTDVSSNVLKEEDWYIYPQPGRPHKPENAPLFVDFDGDGVLDYYQGSHHNALAKGVAPEADGDPIELRLSGENIDRDYGADSHGAVIVDLDGDGVKDLLISVGGALGGTIESATGEKTNNHLLWGEKVQDPNTGQITTIFRGGRGAAEAAGIPMPSRRGRMQYLFDANGDGLLDVYFAADRPRVHKLVPGGLFINQGDRTFREGRSVMEYSAAMLLTDVDGDGFANEFVVTRDMCFTQQPDGYPQDILDFCSTRPAGTTAVFKWNQNAETMEDIGKRYAGVVPHNSKQPPCCQLGKIDTFAKDNKNCYVRSTGSGDFDGDGLADQIFLYGTKLVFYFSSDRDVGTLPFGANLVGAELFLPLTCYGKTLRIFDLDNDGKEELLIGCQDPGEFVVFTRSGEGKADWTLDNGCNFGLGLGDLSEKALAELRLEDFERACVDKHRNPYPLHLCYIHDARVMGREVSEAHLKADTYTKLEGVTTVDLNNDGFTDLVVAYRNGHTLFLQNTPSTTAASHRFITFTLGVQGIGATLILHSDQCDGCERQFREQNSHQHETDSWGYKDDRIFFGLGPEGKPTSIDIRWPDGSVQMKDLRDWEFTEKQEPIALVQE